MKQIYQDKIAQAIELLKEEKIDTWLIYSSEGSDPAVDLLTGIKTVGKTFFIFDQSGKKIAVTNKIDAQESQDSQLFDEVLLYEKDPAETLKNILYELNPNVLALNYSQDDHLCDGLTLGRLLWLKKAIGEEMYAKVTSSEKLLQRLRAVKTESEIKLIQEAIDLTLQIYDTVFSQLKPGMTEFEIGNLFVQEMKKHDVVEGNTNDLSMPIVMNGRIGHRSPSHEKVRPGDFLIIDFSVKKNGYVSDIARTAYFLKEGETAAPTKMQKSFQAVYDAISQSAEAICPGKTGIMIDEIARNHLLEQGLPAITHSLGHQIGRRVHDGGATLGPAWERFGNTPYIKIEKNMCFTLEPTVLLPEGEQSILTEENIVITDTGCRFLSKRQKEIILIPYSE